MGRYSRTPARRHWVARTLVGLGILAASAGATVAITNIVDRQETTAAQPTTTPSASSSISTEPDPTPTDRCPEVTELRIAAVDSIAPVLDGLAEEACLDLALTEVSGTEGALLLETGAVDAWIPDSREYAVAAGAERAAAAPSTGWSPVVMVAEPATADAIAAATAEAAPLGWGVLARDGGTVAGMPVQIADQTSAVQMSVASLVASATQAATGDRYLGIASAAGALAVTTDVADTDLATPVPAGTVRIMEQRDVTEQTGRALVTADGAPVLEHPWIGDTSLPAAVTLLDALSSPDASVLRAEVGLLDPGVTSVALSSEPGAARVPSRPSPGEDALRPAFVLGGTGNLSGHALTVLDASGSMGRRAEDGQARVIETVTQAYATMVRTLNPTTKVGLWEFSYDIAPGVHHRELVPVDQTGTNLESLVTNVTAIQIVGDAGTALNSTTVDAVRAVRESWDPERSNMVLLFTDGRDEDAPGTLGLAEAVEILRSELDPERPVALTMFGMGDADIEAMQQLVDANGGYGGVYGVSSTAQVLGAFTQAIGDTLMFP